MIMTEELLNRITMDPAQCGGKPCVRGMRIRVLDILEMLSNGMREEEIIEDFPYVEMEDIRACLKFAARNVEHPVYRLAAE
jgi:uncharacterized protein (DUF433 family)